ncbi:MAG: radical SAM protein [Opitutaceae bacterium]|nr:radical SAM protein [Opitutaceae bacterium]
MKELFLFVRPPRPLWPFNGPTTAFWPPLAFASLAAALRENVRDLRVEILDAPALEMGWRTLEAELRRRQPAYVGLGEEAVSCVEGLRLARLARDGGACVIAGGCFFGHVAREALGTGLIDVVVHGEGELTIVELVEALRSGQRSDLTRVAGITFADGEQIISTPPRALLPDLDRLPMPAYDLLPVARYGRGSRNHPDFAAIESSRGCVGACDFCVLWRQMGRHVGERTVPCLRAKSPERLREEIRRLTRDFGRRYLGWVDPCFNAHREAPAQLAELLLRDGVHVGQSAWVRADGIVRDAQSGALATCIRAGLNEVYLGVERPDADSLRALNKTTSVDDTRRAFEILARDFPAVFTFGSFIYGLPGDTPKTIREIYRLSLELEMDKAFFIPLTPLPGTPFWRPELWDATGQGFRRFDFLPSSIPGHGALDRTLLWSFALDWCPARFRSYVRGFRCTDARKRRMTWRILNRATWFSAVALGRRLIAPGRNGGMVVPSWYET